MKCPNCGTKNRKGATFCDGCGEKLPEQTEINNKQKEYKLDGQYLKNASSFLFDSSPINKKSLLSIDTIIGMVSLLLHLICLFIPLRLQSPAKEIAESMSIKTTYFPLFTGIGLILLVFIIVSAILVLSANQSKHFIINRIGYLFISFFIIIISVVMLFFYQGDIANQMYGDSYTSEMLNGLILKGNILMSNIQMVAIMLGSTYFVISIFVRIFNKNKDSK